MGVPYVDHLEFQLEKRKFYCRRCSTNNITSQDYLISDQYVANSGKAALFEKVSYQNDFFTDPLKVFILLVAISRIYKFNLLLIQVSNVIKENRGTRHLRSGRYITSDVLCKVCRQVLGWYYEHAFDESQKEKEGRVCLELIKLRGGDEPVEDNEMSEGLNTNFFLALNGELDVIRRNSC